jgi:hypothetical protein
MRTTTLDLSESQNKEAVMDWDRIEGNWKTFKGKAQQQWKVSCRNATVITRTKSALKSIVG